MKHEGVRVRQRLISIPRGTHFQVSSRSERVGKGRKELGATERDRNSHRFPIIALGVRRSLGGGRNGKWAVRASGWVGLREKLGDTDGMFGRLATGECI